MRFGLIFKPLVHQFDISERNITLVSREFPPIFRRKGNGYENRAKVHNYDKSEVCHEVESSS